MKNGKFLLYILKKISPTDSTRLKEKKERKKC